MPTPIENQIQQAARSTQMTKTMMQGDIDITRKSGLPLNSVQKNTQHVLLGNQMSDQIGNKVSTTRLISPDLGVPEQLKGSVVKGST